MRPSVAKEDLVKPAVQWRLLTNSLEHDLVLDRIRSRGEALPDALSDPMKNLQQQKLAHPVLKVLEKVLPRALRGFIHGARDKLGASRNSRCSTETYS
jgi:hypothetical protein